MKRRNNAINICLFVLIAIFVLSDATSPAASDTGIQFIDVTQEAGIHWKHTDGRSGRKYFMETLGSGAAFFDYDADGDADLYFVDGAPLPGYVPEEIPTNRLYRSNGDGTFTDVTEIAGVGDTGYGHGCAVGDYNNDGYLDLYVTNYGTNRLYRNNGDGTFTDVAEIAGVTEPRWSTSCAFADYDRDGDLDLYVLTTSFLTSLRIRGVDLKKREFVPIVNPIISPPNPIRFIAITVMARLPTLPSLPEFTIRLARD